jgi:hypothetical protein
MIVPRTARTNSRTGMPKCFGKKLKFLSVRGVLVLHEASRSLAIN